MARAALKDKGGNSITWLEATRRALEQIGRPAKVEEILEYMTKYVVEGIPSTAKTPVNTIYNALLTHTDDSPSGKNNEKIFRKVDKGVWGLVEDNAAETEEARAVDDDIAFPEGKTVQEEHFRRERNSSLVKKAKENFSRKHDGKLYCEACGFNFSEIYGAVGEGFIEAHHLKPVSEMQEGEKTKIDDLVMLCSNCHSMVHRIRPWISDKNNLPGIILHK